MAYIFSKSMVSRALSISPLALALFTKAFAAILMLIPASFAQAWDGSTVGKIGTVEVTDDGNFGLRVYFIAPQTMCTGGPTWAYLNDSDSNFKTYVGALLAAKMGGNQVVMYTTNVGGYCHNGYVSVT